MIDVGILRVCVVLDTDEWWYAKRVVQFVLDTGGKIGADVGLWLLGIDVDCVVLGVVVKNGLLLVSRPFGVFLVNRCSARAAPSLPLSEGKGANVMRFIGVGRRLE